MSYDKIIIHAPAVVATAPTAVPALAAGVQQGVITDQHLSDLNSYLEGDKYRSFLTSLSPEQQTSYWSQQMTPAMQEAATKAGYAVPAAAAEEGGGGILGALSSARNATLGAIGNVAGAVGGAVGDVGSAVLPDAVGDTAGAVGGALGAAGGEVLDKSSTALSYLNNKYKAGYKQARSQDLYGLGGLAPVVGPVGMSVMGVVDNALHDTDAEEDGAVVWDDSRLAYAKSQLPTDVFDVAKAVVSGKTPETLMAEAQASGDQARLQTTLAILDSGQFGQAMDLVGGAQVSFGRDVAQGLGMNAGSKQFHITSGLTDGAYTAFVDPLMVAGVAAPAIKGARIGVTSMEGAAGLFARPTVQRYMGGMAEHLNTLVNATDAATKAKSMAVLRSQYSQFSPLVDQMVKQNVTDIDKVRDFVTSADGFAQILQGKAAMKTPLMPYRTWAGDKARKLGALANPITGAENIAFRGITPKIDVTALTAEGSDDALKAATESILRSRDSIMGRAATFMSRPVQKVPFGTKIEFNAANSHEEVYKLARFIMPKFWANQTSAAFLAADTAGKRTIVKGLMETMGEVGGITKTAAGKDWWGGYIAKNFNNGVVPNRYSPTISKVVESADDAGNTLKTISYHEPDLLADGRRVGVIEDQMREYIEIPNFRDFYKHMVQLPIAEQSVRGPGNVIGRVITSRGLDAFTEQFWKPGVLLRPALPIRNGMEEVTNFIMQHSAKKYLKGYAGSQFVKREADILRAKVLASTTDDATKSAIAGGDHMAFFTNLEKQRVLKFRAASRNVKGKVAKAFLSPEEEKHLRQFMENGGWQRVTRRMDDSTDLRFSTNNDKLAAGVAGKAAGGQATVVPISGPWEEVGTSGLDGAIKWASYASHIGNSRDVRIALENINDKDAALAKLVDWVSGPDGANMRRSSELLREVGDEEWANRVYGLTKSTFSDRNGDTLGDMISQVLDPSKGFVDAKWIEDTLPVQLRPEFTVGQDFMLHNTGGGLWNGVHNAINKGFGASDSVVESMSRWPTFVPRYLDLRKSMAVAEREMAGKTNEKIAAVFYHRKAEQAAFDHMLEYVDNPAIRSQFSVIMRNVIPFWRAQEEFYVRWAKTAVFSPYGYRKLQLTYQGFENVGVIEKDDQGNAYFTYPLSGAASKAFTGALSKIGIDAYIPVPLEFRSQVRYLNQGLDPKNILPSFGPAPSFLLQSVRSLYPQAAPLERVMLGEQGSGRNPFTNLLPTPVRRLMDTEGSRESAMLSAAAYMEYAGLAPGDDATPDEVQRYKERLQTNAQWMMVFRTIFGAGAPASPEAVDVAPKATDAWRQQGIASVSDEFWALVSSTGSYEDAIGAWMKVHPDLAPFVVSKTETPSGAIVGADAATGDFIAQNKAFFEKYPSAAPFWLASSDGEFDPDTWQAEIALGIKERKTFDEFYSDLKAGPAIEQYYNAREAHESYQATTLASGDSVSADAEAEQYDAWKTSFVGQNPLLADYLAAGGSRAQERINTINQITAAAADPNTPQTAMTTTATSMVQAYNAHQAWQNENDGLDDVSVEARKAETLQYQTYMQGLAGADPGASMLYNRLFRYAE